MKEKRKITGKDIVIPLIALLITLVLMVAGAMLLSPVLDQQAAGIAHVLSAMLLVWFAYSALAKPKVTSREVSHNMMKLRDGGQKAFAILQARLARARRITDVLSVLMAVMVAVMSLLLYKAPGCAIVALFYIDSMLLRFWPQKEAAQPPQWADPADYPMLYALAEKAQAAVGGSRTVRIALGTGCNAGISRQGGQAWIHVGVIMLNTYTQQELYQVLLHEFAHLENAVQAAYARRAGRFGRGKGPFRRLDMAEAELYAYYEVFVSESLERQADRAILEQGDPQAAAVNFAKLACYDLFTMGYLKPVEEIRLFAQEQAPENWISVTLDQFISAVEANRERAYSLIRSQIRPRLTTHPIARERIEALGVTDYEIEFPERQGPWAEEGRRALQWADEAVHKDLTQNWEQARQENWLQYHQDIARWEESGSQLTYELTRKVLEAMYALRRYQDIIDLSQAFADSGASESERCHAIFYEGLARLALEDDTGIDVLYQAVLNNPNYHESGCTAIAEYCSILGMQEQMDRYRDFVDNRMDTFMDHDEIFPLTPRDRLEAVERTDKVFVQNLVVIRQAATQHLKAVYLVRKTISASYAPYIYAMELTVEDEKTREEIYNQVFMHLDKQDEEYALTILDEELGWLRKKPQFRVWSQNPTSEEA